MSKAKPTLLQLSIDQLVRGKYQPRKHFDPSQLQELAESIKTTGGLLQPIVVRPLASGKYEIVAGERRWRAAQLAGLSDVSCLCSLYTDEQTLQASLIENISRADLNPIEEALAYQRLIDEFHYLHDEVAAAVGKSRASITNALRLLKLDSRVQELLISGQISEGHGKILAGLDASKQYELAERCLQKNWSVRKLEAEARKLSQPSVNEGPYSDPNIKHLESALSNHIGNQVEIDCEDRGGGYVKIRFNNIDELEGHFDRLGFKYDN
jgi:ParB family transcriptional regulator, chromosome partitioning protein